MRERKARAGKGAEQKRTGRERHNRPTVIWLALVPALFAVLLVAVGVAGQDDGPTLEPPGTVTAAVSAGDHVQGPVNYSDTPPLGGPHAPVWQNCGFYREAVASETAVHALEHGAVWITYRPDLPRGQVEALRSLAQARTFVLVSPFDGLPSPVVASAWGKQLRLEEVDDSRLEPFVRMFRQGPQTPEPDAPCIGGTGEPTA